MENLKFGRELAVVDCVLAWSFPGHVGQLVNLGFLVLVVHL